MMRYSLEHMQFVVENHMDLAYEQLPAVFGESIFVAFFKLVSR